MPNIVLYNDSVNVTTGEKEERKMMTGMHIVVDTFCVRCGSLVGWRYVSFENLKAYIYTLCMFDKVYNCF